MGGSSSFASLSDAGSMQRRGDLIVHEPGSVAAEVGEAVGDIRGAAAEIAREHGGCRDKRGGRVVYGILTDHGVLPAEEEEYLVLLDGAADGAAKLIPLERIAGRREEVARVHIAVAEKVERVAVEVVGARFGHARNSAAGMDAVLTPSACWFRL